MRRNDLRDVALDEKPERPDELSGAHWVAGYSAALLVMLAAILATDVVFSNHLFVAMTALICIVGTSFSAAFRRVKRGRAIVNGLVLIACAVLGALQFGAARGTRALFGLHTSALVSFDDVNLLELLACVFVWIMAFRAFTLRTFRDLTLSIIPSVSALLLIVILRPELVMVMFFGAVLLGGLYLFSVEHRAGLLERADFAARPRGLRGGRGDPAESSWLSVYGATILVGAGLCALFTSITLPSRFAQEIRIELAQRIADRLVAATGRVYASSSQSLWLYTRTRKLSDREIFRVRCDRELYWRATAYDEYAGWRWGQAKVAGKRWVWDDPDFDARGGERGATRARRSLAFDVDPKSLGEAPTGTEEVRQLVFVRRPMQGCVLAAYYPVRVDGVRGRVRMDRFGGLMTTRLMRSGQQYVVYSRVRRPDWRALAASESDYPDGITKQYTSVPDEVPRRVWDLAAKICEDADDPLSKARAIERYLGEHCKYREVMDRPPWQYNYVDYFLFESKEGYCTHFATAMAVLCRCIGLPSRLAVGYAPGEYDPDNDVYIVREKDAHAWVEVYFNGIGWIQFDPTEAARAGNLSGAAALYDRAAGWWQTISARHGLLRGEVTRADAAVGIGGFAFCFAAILALIVRRRHLRLNPPLPKPSVDDHRGQVRYAYALACRALAKANVTRGVSKTPFEFAGEVAAELPIVAGAFGPLTRQHVRATYGAATPPREAVEEAMEWLRQVVAGVKGGRRRGGVR